jgi:hypothetical protein
VAPGNAVLAVTSGPDKGHVMSLNDGPIEFGPSGLDDPEPIYRIERTDQGTVLSALPERIEHRPKNVLSLIFERIPAIKNAALILAEGKPQRNKWNFCAFQRPPDFSIADKDAVVRCFFGKDGVVTALHKNPGRSESEANRQGPEKQARCSLYRKRK